VNASPADSAALSATERRQKAATVCGGVHAQKWQWPDIDKDKAAVA
jgi:hypothetical protein